MAADGAPLDRQLAQALALLAVRHCADPRLRAAGAPHKGIDLLVDRSAAADIATVAARLGFKRLQAAPGHQTPDSETFCGFDARAGGRCRTCSPT